MKLILILFSTLFGFQLFAQEKLYSDYGTLYHFELKNAPFPDAERDSGYVYRDKHYSKTEHYNDSTALVFIPKYLNINCETDIVVYFHGWNNNVDSVLTKFKLIEQFYASRREAILVMPEGPKNAPDSFGGKLEETGRFKLFIDEVLQAFNKTNDKSLISGNNNATLTNKNITLAGHSGAYRVIAYILMRGGLSEKINEVFLFDGLYADVEKYSYWLDHYKGRFINIYTPNGGTKRESENLMESLTAWRIPYTFIDGDEFTNEELQENKIIFIASQLKHNEVISTKNQFKRFLETGD